MKRIDFQRVWEEAQMDIVMLEQEAERMGLLAAKVRRVHADTYEKVMGEPAPTYKRRTG